MLFCLQVFTNAFNLQLSAMSLMMLGSVMFVYLLLDAPPRGTSILNSSENFISLFSNESI